MISSESECNKCNYFLNNSQLKDGDIILTSSDNIFSKGIRLLTNSNYSHALMIFNQTAYIHALPEGGVQSGNIQRLFFRDKEQVCVLRLKNYKEYQSLIPNACSFLRGELAKGYNFFNAIDVKLKTGRLSNKYTKICSQLIAEAYEYAGIKLVENSKNCSPEDLKKSEFLEKIDIQLFCLDETPSISDQELKKDSYQKKHHQIEQKAISLVRNLKRKELENIYTTKEVLDFLAENQSYDDKEITRCFIEAGYFDDWINIRNKFSYRYGSFDEFFTYLKNDITDIDNRKLEIEIEVINDLIKLSSHQLPFYMKQLEIAKWNFSCTKQSFYEKQIELYTNLCNMYQTLSEHCKKYRELNNI